MLVSAEKKCLNLYTIPIRDSVSVWVEQDLLVPDTKPDAIKIINVTVNPYVTDTEVMDNKIKVTGKVNYYVIYMTNETNMGTRGLYVSLPYTQVITVKGINKNTHVTVKPCVKNVIYSLPNERKIAIKTEVIFKVKGIQTTPVNLIQKFSPECKIETKLNECIFNNLIKYKYNVIASKEDIMLPKENDDLYEILKIDHSIINTEYKESYNKIMVKGDIQVSILYLVDNAEAEIKKCSIEIPFSGMIEMDNINDKSNFNIDYYINDFNLKTNIDVTSAKTLSVDYQIGINVGMFEQERVEYVDDFYSEDKELKYEMVSKSAVRDISTSIKTIEIKEMLNNIFPENTRIIDYNIDTSHVTLKKVNNTIHVEGNLKLSVLIQNTTNLRIESKVVDVLVSEEFIVDDLNPNTNLSLGISVDRVNVLQNGNDLDVKLRLNIIVKYEDVVILNITDNIDALPIDITNIDSMNIYIVKPGDSLWAIAKKYNTTVEKIVLTNDITDQSIINVGQKILIIR